VRLLIIPPITVALAVIPACADERHAAAPATSMTTSTTTAPSTTRPDPTAAVLAAYQRFWQVWLEANNPPNPNDPALAEVDTGAQLARDRAAIAENLRQGIEFRQAQPSHARHRPVILSIAAHAVIQDCAIDDGVVVDRATGNVVNADVVTYLWRATLTRQGGLWKVSDYTREGRWTGATDCGLGGHS
jgi:hypothetical protein